MAAEMAAELGVAEELAGDELRRRHSRHRRPNRPDQRHLAATWHNVDEAATSDEEKCAATCVDVAASYQRTR